MEKMCFAIALFLSMLVSATVSASSLIYIPTGEANDLVVVDASNDTIVKRIPELENAHGLAGNPHSKYLVAGSMQVAANSSSNTVQKPAAVSEEDHSAHHADTSQNKEKTNSNVAIIHINHGHVVRRISVRGLTHHTAVSPDGKYAVAVHPGAGGISVIDLTRLEIIKELQTGRSANYAVFNLKGTTLYVSNAFSNSVSEIDTSDWSVKRNYEVGKEPEHLVINRDGSMLFVVNVADKQVAVINTNTGLVTQRFDVGMQAHGLGLSPDERWLFVSSQGEGKLTRIDLKEQSQTHINLHPAPYHVEYLQGANKIYVSSRKQPKIWIVDPQSLAVRGEINIGSGVAHQMVTIDD